MPIYVGDGRHETYRQQPNGKWRHGLSNGREFDSLEEAKRDYASRNPGGGDAFSVVLFILIPLLIAAAAVLMKSAV